MSCPRIFARYLFGWLVGLSLLAAPSAAHAQTVTLALPVPATDDLAIAVEAGSRLERDRRWAEALTYWEDAYKRHPDRADFQARALQARAHYDVCRRYGDQSYLKALGTLSERDALAIYDEVLLKVQSHYVHEPQWQKLVESGLLNVKVAVSESPFVQRNLATAPVERLTALPDDAQKLAGTKPVADRRQAYALVQNVAYGLRDRYGLSPQAVVFEFTSGAAAALDEYSGFLTGGQMDEVFSQIEGNFVGLGVELKTEPAGLAIVNVISSGPAYLGGIRPGDCIIAVDGKTTADVSPDAMADLLRGPEGSFVEVVVRDPNNVERRLRLARRRVEVPSVDQVKMLDSQYGIGYFKLTSFQKTTSRDVDAALWKLHEQGLRHLIIDLRGNPGGLLKAAVDVADKFVYDGLIVATRGRSPREDFDHKGEVAGTWRVPLVILIDHDSASASEILAGAIRDHRRGTVIGETSYGKGSVQGIFPLAVANVGIRLTTAKWYTPSGKAISGSGIQPDVVVHSAARPANGQLASAPNGAADPILNAGLQAARTQLASQPSSRRPN
jgi:carboxyl-terminal processing protease